MATRVITTLISDLSGSEGDETVSFGLDGTDYTIDLTEKEAAALRKALARYVEAGTRKAGRKGKRGSLKPVNGPSAKEIREWAKANGWDVPERGRIPDEIREAYRAAG